MLGPGVAPKQPEHHGLNQCFRFLFHAFSSTSFSALPARPLGAHIQSRKLLSGPLAIASSSEITYVRHFAKRRRRPCIALGATDRRRGCWQPGPLTSAKSEEKEREVGAPDAGSMLACSRLERAQRVEEWRKEAIYRKRAIRSSGDSGPPYMLREVTRIEDVALRSVRALIPFFPGGGAGRASDK
jgi:hypothetical protein